jgi:hypothetical protein
MMTLDTSVPTPPIYHAEQFDGVDTIAISDASWIRVAVRCLDGAGPPCQPEDGIFVSSFGLRTSTVTLVDRLTPVVESASGQATTESQWNRSESLAFSATDRGGGIYRVLVEVDVSLPLEGRPAGRPALPGRRLAGRVGLVRP